MPNTVVPGFEEILGPALAHLTSAVSEKLRPNALFQKKMQEQLATNPELVVKLAGIAAKDPTVLSRMGFSEEQAATIMPQESTKDKFERTNEKGILAGSAAALASQTVGSQVSAAEGEAMFQIMKDNPTITKEAALAILRKPVQQGKLADMEVTKEQQRAKFVMELPEGKVDFYKVVRDQAQGKLPPGVLASYMADPSTKAAYEAADNQFRLQQELDARELAHKNAKKDTAADRLDARQAQNAFVTYQKSGMAGTVETWQKFLYDPVTQKKAADLLSGKIKPQNFEDENLLEVARGASKVGISRFNSDVNVLNNQGKDILKRLDGGLPTGERDKAITDLNLTFEKRSKLDGSPKIVARWRDFGWSPNEIFSQDRIEYTDSKGKVLDPDRVEQSLADPAIQAQLSTRAQTALGRINTLSDDAALAAAMALYEGDDNSPNKQDSKGVREELRRMGRIK